ncbi:MAG: thioredoxin family protein [Methanomicrobiales archaeon]|nr:thioredoxin family protein [Methanomicrobiales archaeon]MDI6875733.1 thioredoxin family protein [Methanomicrobiales archaeon]
MVTIEVLGTGCPKCRRTIRNVEEAVKELKIQADIRKVDDITEIMSRGVMLTPAVFIDGEEKVVGRVPCVEELKELLQG